MAKLSEVRHMIEARALYAKGIGLVDAHLLASCLMTPGTQLMDAGWCAGESGQESGNPVSLAVGVPCHQSDFPSSVTRTWTLRLRAGQARESPVPTHDL